MKNVHLEMIRVTEAAALAAAKYVGCGDKVAADKAATEAMRSRLNNIDFAAKCVLCEGEKDGAPMLANGEWVGRRRDSFMQAPASEPESQAYMKQGKCYELAVDPVDGTTQVSRGGYEAIAVLALAEENGFMPISAYYMRKLAVGPEVASKVDLCLNDPVRRTIKSIATALGKDTNKVSVCVLDRPRHDDLIRELRELGCVIRLISDCDVTGAIATCMPDSGIDVLMGIGGAPEGTISAAAIKCMRGAFQGQICDKNGTPLDPMIYETNDLVRSETVFCATGITNGRILEGIRFTPAGPITNSILMRSQSGTVRFIKAMHGN